MTRRNNRQGKCLLRAAMGSSARVATCGRAVEKCGKKGQKRCWETPCGASSVAGGDGGGGGGGGAGAGAPLRSVYLKGETLSVVLHSCAEPHCGEVQVRSGECLQP